MMALTLGAALTGSALLVIAPAAQAYPGCGTQDIARTSQFFDKPVSASSSERGDLGPAAAFDGDDSGTRWASAFAGLSPDAADRQYLQIDLKNPQPICGVDLVWERAYASGYEIQVSDDGQTWRPVYTVTKGRGGTENLLFAATGRYVRMQSTKRATGYGVSLYSMKVHIADGTFNPPPPVDPPGATTTPTGTLPTTPQSTNPPTSTPPTTPQSTNPPPTSDTPDFGPNVTVFDQNMATADVQAKLDAR